MKLLVFAHFAESRAFLEREEYASVRLPFSGLWQGREHFILIGGEGGEESAVRTAYVLGKFPAIGAVYNLGTAAGLSSQVERGTVHSIRTCYRCQGEDSIAFHSFSSSDSSANKDIITSDVRITSAERANFLESFAPLADREAHSLARIAQRSKIPFYSFKVVSDHPSSRDSVACEDVRQRSDHYSRLLLDFYQNHQTPAPRQAKTLSIPEGFYFSITMKRRYQTLKDSLAPSRLDKIIHRLRQSPLSPKERGKALLQRLEVLSLPPQTEKELEQIFASLRGPQRQISYGQSLESEKFYLQTGISSSQDIDDLIVALQTFDYSRFKRLFSNV